MAYWDCWAMMMLGWQPGTVINMRVQQQGLFMAYIDKMNTDDRWKELLKVKYGVRL